MNNTPMAYAVYCPIGSEFDYMVFANLDEAYFEVNKDLCEGDPEPEIIPLYSRET